MPLSPSCWGTPAIVCPHASPPPLSPAPCCSLGRRRGTLPLPASRTAPLPWLKARGIKAVQASSSAINACSSSRGTIAFSSSSRSRKASSCSRVVNVTSFPRRTSCCAAQSHSGVGKDGNNTRCTSGYRKEGKNPAFTNGGRNWSHWQNSNRAGLPLVHAAPNDGPLSSREDTAVKDRTLLDPSTVQAAADNAVVSSSSTTTTTTLASSPSVGTLMSPFTTTSSSSSGQAAEEEAMKDEVPSLLASALDDPRLPVPYRKDAGRRSMASMDEADGMSDVINSGMGLGPVLQWFTNSEDLLTLAYAVLTGTVVAGSVFVFDCSIQLVHDLPDIFAQDFHVGGGRATGLVVFGTAVPFRCIMPVGAGFFVAYLQSRGFSPALRFLTRAIEGVVDDKQKAAFPTSYWQVFRKAAASVITLGSGASLGPEAPSVELGANTAAVLAPKSLTRRKQRMLVAAGAAAGVSAAFDAPVAGALFAVEFVLKSSRLGLDRLSTSTVFVSTSVAAGVVGFLRAEGQELGITGAAAHLVGRIPYFTVQPDMLLDLLQFGALGLGAAVAATLLYEGTRISELLLRPLPRYISAPLAGLLCGVIAFKFPQVQYGYVNLEEIFRGSADISLMALVSLLGAKIVATSVCAGGGLVGGLFAPSLFMGALVGDIFGLTFAQSWGLSDPTTLVVVGAAAVLGAACRAPLTAVALMVEITRDTGLLVPLLVSIGTASVMTEYLEGIFTKQINESMLDLYIKEKALLIATGISPAGEGGAPAPTVADVSIKTVESLMCTSASLYVRHTLPIEQAKQALEAKQSQAAVVVDDNFNPMGLVYLEDIEAELVKQQLLLQPDSNFDRQP